MDALNKFIELQNSTLTLSYRENFLDQSIDTKLKEIVKECAHQLDADRVSIWLYQESKSAIQCQHLYQKASKSFDSGMVLLEQDYPNYFSAIKSNRVLDAKYAASDPRTQEFLDNYLTPLSIESMLDVPILPHKNFGGVLCIEYTHRPTTWDMAEISYALSIADVISLAYAQEEWIQQTQKLQFSERVDSLTNLENRYYFQKRIERDKRIASRKEACTLISIGLNNFTAINDKLGYDFANLVLCTIASRLESSALLDGSDIARIGGDEFAVWIYPGIEPDQHTQYIEHLQQIIGESISVSENDTITISASIGLFNGDIAETNQVDPLRKAEIAMTRAKSEGTFCIYDKVWESDYQKEQKLEQDFFTALEQGQFVLHFQPIIGLNHCQDGMTLEALVRWQHPENGLLYPDVILPLAKRLGQMKALGDAVIEQAFKGMSDFSKQGIKLNRISINIVSEQLNSQDLITNLTQASQRYGVPLSKIEFEIVEEVIAVKSSLLSSQLLKLKQLGVQVSIDDFGTGYSCLSRLKNLQVSKLKIDKSFVDGLPSDEDDICIASSIIGMAKGLNLSIVAEGVETSAQAKWLLENGCDFLQGYLLSKPIPADEVYQFAQTEIKLASFLRLS